MIGMIVQFNEYLDDLDLYISIPIEDENERLSRSPYFLSLPLPISLARERLIWTTHLSCDRGDDDRATHTHTHTHVHRYIHTIAQGISSSTTFSSPKKQRKKKWI
jgi:hypothetical protein